MTNKGNGKMLTVVAGELKFTDTICGEQAYWTWEQEDFLWGVIRHKVNNQPCMIFELLVWTQEWTQKTSPDIRQMSLLVLDDWV